MLASTVRNSPKPKTVRIASPEVPTSPYSAYYFSDSSPSSPELSRSGTRLKLPPPEEHESPSDEEGSPIDPFNAGGSDGEEEDRGHEAFKNTISNANSTGKADLNMADHTLGRFASRPRSIASESQTEKSNVAKTAGQQRQTMDVDAFKRLLLTGDASIAAAKDTSPSVTSPHHAIVSDSSSNTDTASISRQSIFEPLPALSTDTPRTSHELSPEDADDERARLTGKEPAGRKRPPPPRTRHGKSIKNTQPVPLQSPPRSQTLPATPSAKMDTSPADLNKPLPEPPFQDPWVIEGQQSEEPAVTSLPASAKRPPTPPITRRKSHLRRSDSTRSSSGFSLSVSSPTESSSEFASNTPLSKPRPTPPTRRSNPGLVSPELGSQTPSTDGILSPSEASFENDISQPETTSPKPSVPPTRQSSLGKQPTARPLKSTSAAPPPPPPPPRRLRGSSRSSTDTSGAHHLSTLEDVTPIASGRRPSAESSRSVSGASTANDILADLAALQKEVDDLRSKQQARKSSAGSP